MRWVRVVRYAHRQPTAAQGLDFDAIFSSWEQEMNPRRSGVNYGVPGQRMPRRRADTVKPRAAYAAAAAARAHEAKASAAAAAAAASAARTHEAKASAAAVAAASAAACTPAATAAADASHNNKMGTREQKIGKKCPVDAHTWVLLP